MSIAWRDSLAAGALALAALSLGCDPTPDYGPLQPPYFGWISAEDSVVTTGQAQQLGFLSSGSAGQHAVTVSLPAQAYPPGTRVTLRWVSSPGFATDESVQLGAFVGGDFFNYDSALQLLPTTPAPASAPTVVLIGTGLSTYDLLHATECDAAWQVVGTASAVLSTPSSSLSFPLSAPGFWTLGQKAPGDAGTVSTTTHLYGADCPDSPDGGTDGGQQD